MVRANVELAEFDRASPLARILRRAADAWRPVEHPPTPDWCAAEVRLPSDTSADPGPFDLASRPYWREPLALFDDPEVLTISIMAGAQDGKTVLLTAALLSRAFLDPAPAMLAGPDQDAMRELRDRVYAMAEASPAVAPRIPPARLRNDRWLDFGSMYCYLAFSGSPQRLRGRTCKYVFCTEVDVWQDSPRLGRSARLVRARVKAFNEYKIVNESTPTDEASTIDAFYRASDQRKFHVECPHCGHYQELRFFPHKSGPYAGRGGVAGMQDADGKWRTADEARRLAYYVCEAGGCRIESHEKPAMVEGGVWCPRGCRVEKGKLVGTPERSRRNAGYQISSLYAPQNTFGDVAAAYLEHREENSLREFFNNWLGLKYSSGEKLPHWKALARKLAWTHSRGTVDPDCWFLTAAADVQQERCYWVVRGWGDRKTSWLIDWGMLRRDHAALDGSQQKGEFPIAPDLAQLVPAVIARRWPVSRGTNPRGLAELPVRVLGVDAGHRTLDVHHFVRSYPGDRVRAIHGDHKVEPEVLYRAKKVERNSRTGEPYPGGMVLWGIYVNAYKEDLLGRYSLDPTAPGGWRLPCDVLTGGEDYLRQIVNESPLSLQRENQRPKIVWVTRDKALGEHYWDCEVYNSALADMVVGGDWDASHWPQANAAPPAPPLTLDPLASRAEPTEIFSAR